MLSEEELNELSQQFNNRLEVVMPGKDRARSWYTLFKEIDNIDDESGLITYDELYKVVRTKLKIRRADLADIRVKALWCSLDSNASDHIGAVEMARFMRRAGPGTLQKGLLEKRQALVRQKTTMMRSEAEKKTAVEVKDQKLVSQMSTPDMRKQIAANGVSEPDDDQITAYAHQFTAKLAEVFPDKDRSTAWFGLFDTDS